MQALGYPEILRHLAGELSLAELEDEIVLRTRQFARRQRTWFRRFDDLRWVDLDMQEDPANAVREVLSELGWA